MVLNFGEVLFLNTFGISVKQKKFDDGKRRPAPFHFTEQSAF